ncbi:MAG: protein-L-isoaspartate O-methyltransferase, partial [Polaromonas sp. 28-63-22]
MVHKLQLQGVADAQVLAAMGLVERHRFVDSALVNQAYEDTSLPIGLGQTISKP